MMVGVVPQGSFEILFVPGVMILFFAVILIRMHAAKKPTTRKNDRQR